MFTFRFTFAAPSYRVSSALLLLRSRVRHLRAHLCGGPGSCVNRWSAGQAPPAGRQIVALLEEAPGRVETRAPDDFAAARGAVVWRECRMLRFVARPGDVASEDGFERV